MPSQTIMPWPCPWSHNMQQSPVSSVIERVDSSDLLSLAVICPCNHLLVTEVSLAVILYSCNRTIILILTHSVWILSSDHRNAERCSYTITKWLGLGGILKPTWFQPLHFVLVVLPPDQAAQNSLQPGLGHLQGLSTHNCSEQPFFVSHHPLIKEGWSPKMRSMSFKSSFRTLDRVVCI